MTCSRNKLCVCVKAKASSSAYRLRSQWHQCDWIANDGASPVTSPCRTIRRSCLRIDPLCRCHISSRSSQARNHIFPILLFFWKMNLGILCWLFLVGYDPTRWHFRGRNSTKIHRGGRLPSRPCLVCHPPATFRVTLLVSFHSAFFVKDP